MAVASSGITATLLKGGKTAHWTLKLPLNLSRTDEPVCSVGRKSVRARLLQETDLIVWDECTMSHRKALEAVDRTLQNIKRSTEIMGNVVVVLTGDFRQTLPVIERGTKADEIGACLKSSYLWKNVTTLKLKTNMRATLFGDETARVFSEQLLSIGNGDLFFSPTDDLHHLPCGQWCGSREEMIQNVFPNVSENFLQPAWLCERAVLAPRNDVVDDINFLLLEKIKGEMKTYKSFDETVDEQNAVSYPNEYLHSLQPPGKPPYNLMFKVGAPLCCRCSTKTS